MELVRLEDAVARFEDLVERVESGEEFLITRPGGGVALLRPVTLSESP